MSTHDDLSRGTFERVPDPCRLNSQGEALAEPTSGLQRAFNMLAIVGLLGFTVYAVLADLHLSPQVRAQHDRLFLVEFVPACQAGASEKQLQAIVAKRDALGTPWRGWWCDSHGNPYR